MRDLPTGTVSMLFSDIEGSTVLLGRLGAHYLEALDDHRRILREAWAAHGGTEMGTEGDSFFVVFSTAPAAVAAAVQAQRGLEAHPWGAGETIRVRIGVHTGSPQVHDDDYWGMDVHRGARIAAAAHGGQVVLSAATADLARQELPQGTELRDLGAHHLKDIPEPERLYQLSVTGLPQDFPALRSLGTTSSLPHPATPLVGRDDMVDELGSLLGSSEVRLLTLTGPGGSGKTRLAVAVAERLAARFPDGVFFVPLASVTAPDVMWTSVAETLDVPPRERTPDRLLALLASKSLLMVLDNLEQLAGADLVVDRVLDGAPGVSVLTTSRQALGLTGEHRVPVAPLSLPEDETLGAADRSGAVRLFVQRARSVQPSFRLGPDNVHDVITICRRLDGLPLAIELCAARIRLLAPRALLTRLDQPLDISSTSRLTTPRQRTLRETIDWSYQLLTGAQQAFFRRLGVLAGGGGLDAVAAVTATDGAREGTGTQALDPLETVAELVDVSLVEPAEGPDCEPRIRLLETIHSFAGERLRAAGEDDDAHAAHAAHYAGLAERLRELHDTNHVTALELAEADLENFREALEWCVPGSGQPGDPETGLRLCAAFGWVWWTGGYVTEGRRWHERVIAAADGSESTYLAASLGGLANLLLNQGEARRAHELAEQSLAMARSLNDSATEAQALGLLGTAEQQLGDVEAACATWRAALAAHRARQDMRGLSRVMGHLAGIESSLGRLEAAESLIRESMDIDDRLGDVHAATVQRQNLANLLAIAGRVEEAGEIAGGLVDTVIGLRDPSLTMAFANTCMNILIQQGEPVRAARLFGAEEEMHRRLDMPNPFHDEELEEALAQVAVTMSAEEWNHHRKLGQDMRVEDLLVELRLG